MDRTSNFEESLDLGFQPSPSYVDQSDGSFTETASYSVFSQDSFAYSRTNSEASAFSECIDDNSYPEVSSPHCWRGLKSPARVALSRLSMKQLKHGMDEQIFDLGEVFTLSSC